MAEPEDDPHTEDVRRFALGTYLPPILVFAIILAALLLYWRQSPPPDDAPRSDDVRAEGTAGERSRGDKTPGGHNPDRAPSSPDDEVAYRSGRIITELGDVLEDNGRDAIGRRVELRDVDVERVESATLFWIRDGNARVAVATSPGATPRVTPLRAGQAVDITGTVERSGESVRIGASRVAASR